jgi:WD40 repeat protein
VRLMFSMEGHTDLVREIVCHKSLLASASCDRSVRVWDLGQRSSLAFCRRVECVREVFQEAGALAARVQQKEVGVLLPRRATTVLHRH